MSDPNNNGGNEPSNNTPNPQEGPPNTYSQGSTPQPQDGQGWQQQPTQQYTQPNQHQGAYAPQQSAYNPQQGAYNPQQGQPPVGSYGQQAYGTPPVAGQGNGGYYAQNSQNFDNGEKKNNKVLIIVLSIVGVIILIAGIAFAAVAMTNANKPEPAPPVTTSEPAPTETDEEAPPTEEEEEVPAEDTVELQADSLSIAGTDGTVFTYGPALDSDWEYVKTQDKMAAYQSFDGQCQMIVSAMELPTTSGDDTTDTKAFLGGFIPSFGGVEADIDATLKNVTIDTTDGSTLEMAQVLTTSKGQSAAVISRVLGESDIVLTHVIMCGDASTLESVLNDPYLGQAVMIDTK